MTPTQFYHYVSGWLDSCRNNGDEANAEQLECLQQNWENVVSPPEPPLPPFSFPAEMKLVLDLAPPLMTIVKAEDGST